MRKELGKIKSVTIGYCGYQDGEIGFQFTLGGENWNVVAPAYSACASDPDERCKWTKEDQLEALGTAWLSIRDLIRDAKVKDVRKLVGIPIEATFDGQLLKSWRILSEVL